MHNEFMAIIESDGEWYIAYSPEIPGANGQAKPESTEGRPWGQPLKKPAGAPLNLG